MTPLELILLILAFALIVWILPVIGNLAGNSLRFFSYVLPRRARKFYQ